MNNTTLFKTLLLVVLITASACAVKHKITSEKTPTTLKLVWSDEFNKTGLPDSTKWGYDFADGCPNVCGWGNNEWQYYTVSRKENTRVEDGHLVIEARQEKMGNKDYTSARMVTKGKGDWTYGRIDVRAKLPKGRGVWPAIWMLPSTNFHGNWPTSGEIDIMENVGFMPDSLFGTIHNGSYNWMLKTQVVSSIYSNTLSADYHTYSLDWNADKMDFLFDDKVFHTFINAHTDVNAWPFDKDFHLILNIAVGGNWGGKMGVDAAIWPQQMLVDYVRVYQ
jgi:beta-glucanase (GH16 family)